MGAQAMRADRQGRPDGAAAAWIGVAVLLGLATFLAFTHLQRFETVPTPWPYDPGFASIADGTAPDRDQAEPAPVAGWEVEGPRSGLVVERDKLVLRNDDPEGGVGIRQLWRLDPEGPHAFRLAATVASEGIVGQRIGLRVGEVTLVADADIARPHFGVNNRLAGLRGTHPLGRYVEYFKFPGGTQQVELAIRLRHATGQLTVGGLELRALVERPLFHWLTLALQATWAVVLAAGCWLFWRGVDHRPSALTLAAAGAAGFLLLMMPEGLREATISRVIDLLPRRLAHDDIAASLGHFLIFAALGFLLRLSRRAEAWWLQIALLVALAGLSELLQFMAELRSPTLDDWLTDTLGALTGWLPAMAWLWWRQEGQFSTQRCSSTTVPPQPAKH